MMSSASGGSSLGGLNELVDPDYEPEGSKGSSMEKKKKELPTDKSDDDEDEEIDVGDNERESFKPNSPPAKAQHTPSKIAALQAAQSAYYSPRRRTRSCAVPDVYKTKTTVTLDDLMKNRILKPGMHYFIL